MVVSPGGWRSAWADFFRARSCSNVRLYSFGDGDDEVKKLPLTSLLSPSLSPWSSSGAEEKDDPQLPKGNHISHPEPSQDVDSVSCPRILVLETRGDSTDHSSSAGSQLSEENFNSLCASWGFSRHFCERMGKPGALPRFEHVLDTPEDEEVVDGEDEDDGNGAAESSLPQRQQCLNALELGFSWGPGHGSFVIAMGRYLPSTRTLYLFVSSNGILEYSGWISGSSTSSDLLNHATISSLLTLHKPALRRNPLVVIPLLLECCERFLDIKAQQYNLHMLHIGTTIETLYPTAFTDWFKSWGLNSAATSEQNGLLFDCYNDVTWSEKNCAELLKIVERYLWLAELLIRHPSSIRRTIFLPLDLARSAHHRILNHSYMLAYIEKMITTQFNVQYNHLVQKDAEVSIQISRATKRDGESMKTIAYLTLFFLPVTFVCAIFSTTVFDFGNWDIISSSTGLDAAASERVVSRGWWVFVLSCVIAMVGTIGAWFILVVKKRREGG